MGCPAHNMHWHHQMPPSCSTAFSKRSSLLDASLMGSQVSLTMMLLCFLAYMLYTTAWRFTTSRASLASLIKPDASASSLCARKSCFVLLSTYLQERTSQGGG